MQAKCEQKAWTEETRGAGRFWLLIFDPRDLTLYDHELVANEAAKTNPELRRTVARRHGEV